LKNLEKYLKSYPQSPLQHIVFLPNLILRYFKHLQRLKRYKKLGFNKTFPFQKITQYKHTDTLFILGSGSSINKINGHQWKIIENNDSVGFNFWLIHDFIPTFYVAELKGDDERISLFYRNLNIKIEQYKNIPFLLKYREEPGLFDLNLLSQLNCVCISSPISIPGINKEAFAKWISLLDLIKTFSKNAINGFIPFKQASVSWLIIFALKLGYKNIVLCGIDLNTTEYFFEQNKTYYLKKNILIPPSGQDGKVHMTNDPDHCDGDLIIKDVIDVLYRKLLRRKNINLYVGSSSSALYPDIPLYSW